MHVSKCFNNRKAQLGSDLLIWVLVLFVFGIVLVVGNNVSNEINDDLQLDDDLNNRSKAILQEGNDNLPLWGDNVFIMVLMLFWVFLIISSFMIDTNPIFFFVSIVLLILVLLVGGLISNTYEDVTTSDQLSTYADDFPKMNWVFSNLLLVLIVISVSTSLALYAKGRG